jgi:hypothetical protein
MMKPAVFRLVLVTALVFLDGVASQVTTVANRTTTAPTSSTTTSPPANVTTTAPGNGTTTAPGPGPSAGAEGVDPDTIDCPAFPPGSAAEPTCRTCLESNCSWTIENCYNRCAVMDAPCYNQDNFPNMTVEMICTNQEASRNESTMCGTQKDCQTCVGTEYLPNGGNCEWYADHDYCGTGGCILIGCGESSCNNATQETPLPCPNVTDDTCNSCVNAGCGWLGEGACYIDCNVSLGGKPCYSLEAGIDSVATNDICKEYDASLQSSNQTNATGPPPTLTGANSTVDSRPRGMTCTTSDQCRDDEFCSSSNETCVMLNCSNWIAGVPTGNISYSEAPCISEESPKGVSFCGWDGECHRYGCENWYKYGPVAFTSYDPNKPVNLTCAEYKTGATENLNSIVFGCRPYQPGFKAPEGKTWTYFFNQECKATPRGSDEFKCYENKDGTDYRDFQGEVSRINQASCDREQEAFTEQPLYWYIVQARQERKGETINYKEGRDNTAMGASFDASEADRTMFSLIISDTDAPAPTVLSPTNAPTAGAISNFGRISSTLFALMAAAFFFL